MNATFLDDHLTCLQLSSNPQIHLIWKPNLMVRGQKIRPDALIHYQDARDLESTTVLVEIDEREITPDSRRREQLLGIPTLRITPGDLIKTDFFDSLMKKLREVTGRQGRTPGKACKKRQRGGWLSFN